MNKFSIKIMLIVLSGAMVFATGQTESSSNEVLEIAVFAGPIRTEFWQVAIGEFKTRFPDVEVKLTAGPKVSDQVRINIATGDTPDVYFSAGAGKISVEQLVTEGLIIPLNDLLESTEWNGNGTLGDSLIPGRIQKLNGSIYGIEVPFHLAGFFYHEPTFKKHGWEIPNNFNEFMELAPRIAATGISPMVTTGIYPYYFEHFVMRNSVISEGGLQAALDWVNLEPGFFVSDVFKGVVEKLEWIVQNGYLMDESIGLNHTASQSEWIHGKAAFIPCGTWLESEMKNDFPEGFSDGIRFMPSFLIDPGSSFRVVYYGNAPITVFKGNNETMAKEFIKALYSPQVMSQLTAITNIMTNVPAANDISPKSPAINSAIDWLNKHESTGWPVGGYSTQDVTKVIQGNLQALMSGELTSDEFCKNVEAVAENVRNDASISYFEAYIP